MNVKGLGPDGTIAREGRLDRIPPAFAAVVDAALAEVTAWRSVHRLHSGYLYGSVPRGTAVPGRSDLDLLIVLRGEPDDADRDRARAVEASLDRRFPAIDGAGILLFSTDRVLSSLERHDLGFFVACLCTPLTGDDLGGCLPRYRPTSLLARETNGDLELLLPRWRRRATEAASRAERRALTRGVGRRLVRTGFTLVMPRWGGWTSDLDEAAELFSGYYPQRAEQMSLALEVSRRPSDDLAVLGTLVEDLGAWLADEYIAVHGRKAPRVRAELTATGDGPAGPPGSHG